MGYIQGWPFSRLCLSLDFPLTASCTNVYIYSASGAYILCTMSFTWAYSEPKSTTSGVARGALPKLELRESFPLMFILAIASVTMEKFFRFNFPGCYKRNKTLKCIKIWLFFYHLQRLRNSFRTSFRSRNVPPSSCKCVLSIAVPAPDIGTADSPSPSFVKQKINLLHLYNILKQPLS